MKILLVMVVLSCLALSGCYHLRMNAEPLDREVLEVGMNPAEVFEVITGILVQDGFRFEQHDSRTDTLVTEFRYFHKDTGPGQPVGGRDYYYQLRVTVTPVDGGAEILLEIPSLEMRTSYVYDAEGSIRTLFKRYPYEHYPGMFDLRPVERELHRVEEMLRRSVR